jgi:hypothetical protein
MKKEELAKGIKVRVSNKTNPKPGTTWEEWKSSRHGGPHIGTINELRGEFNGDGDCTVDAFNESEGSGVVFMAEDLEPISNNKWWFLIKQEEARHEKNS